MTITIIWQNKDQADYSVEYFSLTSEYGINTMKGTVIFLLDQVPSLVNYEIVSDKYWKTRSIKISQQMPDNKSMNIYLRVSHDQNWREYDTYHRSTIIDFASGLMNEKEIEEMREEFGPAIQMDAQNRYIERIIMPNLFDIRARDRQPVN